MWISLQEARDNICSNTYVLPAIQRDFIWEPDKIECLFDSIMRGYPIGTFLFWKMNPMQKESYRFYKFNDNYTKGERQQIITSPLTPHHLYAVLDGQQRLTSVCIALAGCYTFSRRGNVDPQQRRFYFNLLNNHNLSDAKYEFKFLSDKELVQDETHFWYLVNDVLKNENWPSGAASAYEVYLSLSERIEDENLKKIFTAQRTEIVTKLSLLYQRIRTEKLLVFSEIETEYEDEILDIFVRLNSQGKILKGTDLIFSKIVGFWEDAREKIENLIDNPQIKKFKIFDKDFIMKICLALINNEVVTRIKVSNFQRETVLNIRNNWDKIEEAILETSRLLVSLGYDTETVTSSNAIVPLTYFIFLGGEWKTPHGINDNGKDIKRYLAAIRIAQTFSEKTTDKLKTILKEIKENKADRPFNALLKNKIFEVKEENVEAVLNFTKGRDAFSILSLLYDRNYEQCNFSQDHMHPVNAFKKSNLEGLGLSSEVIDEWTKKCDTLPNLQILTSSENSSKNDTPLEQWVDQVYPETEPVKRDNYFKESYLENDMSLKFADFEDFYKKRKLLLKKAIMQKLM